MIILDNYKQYLEFFKKADKAREKKMIKIIHILGWSFLIAMIQSLISIPVSIAIIICASTYCIKKASALGKKEQIEKEVIEHIKRKYPHINADIEYTELYKELYKEGIIKYEDSKLVTCEEEYLNKFGIKKEEKKELEITKDNYKGYLEYYQYESPKSLKKGFITFSGCLLGIIVLNLIFKNTIVAARTMTFLGAISTIGIMYKVLKKEDEKTKQKFEEKYPYLDWERTDEEISRALENAKIIKFEGSKCVICEEELLNKKIQKEITYETNENLYEIKNSELINFDQETQKANQKVKTRIRDRK